MNNMEMFSCNSWICLLFFFEWGCFETPRMELEIAYDIYDWVFCSRVVNISPFIPIVDPLLETNIISKSHWMYCEKLGN